MGRKRTVALGAVGLMLVLAACSSAIDSANTCTDLAQALLETRVDAISEDEYLRASAKIDRLAAEAEPGDTVQLLTCSFASDLLAAEDSGTQQTASVNGWFLIGVAIIGSVLGLVGARRIRRVRSRGPALERKEESFGENPIDVWRPPG